MGKGLVNRHIIVPPREMRRRAQCLARARAARNRAYVYVIVDQTRISQWQNGQFNACRKAAWVGNFRSTLNLPALQFRQAVDEAIRLVPEIRAQVDYFYCCRQLVFIQKLFRLTMA